MKRKKVVKKTYKEFMAWLEGMECSQPDNWVPSNEQWKAIRNMLDNLKPEVEIRETVIEQQPLVQQPTYIQPPYVAHTQNAFESPQSSLDQQPQQQTVPQRLMPSALTTREAAAPGVPAPTTTKQGDVLDTSKNDYQSEFI